MNFYLDLFHRRKTTKIQLVFALLFILISILWIANRIFQEQHIGLFDWLYSLFFFLNGIINLLEYIGKPIDQLIGSSYIKINNEEIIYKSNFFKSEHVFRWENIEYLTFKATYIEFYVEQKTVQLKYHGQEYAVVQELKNVIATLAQEKGILIN